MDKSKSFLTILSFQIFDGSILFSILTAVDSYTATVLCKSPCDNVTASVSEKRKTNPDAELLKSLDWSIDSEQVFKWRLLTCAGNVKVSVTMSRC